MWPRSNNITIADMIGGLRGGIDAALLQPASRLYTDGWMNGYQHTVFPAVPGVSVYITASHWTSVLNNSRKFQRITHIFCASHLYWEAISIYHSKE